MPLTSLLVTQSGDDLTVVSDSDDSIEDDFFVRGRGGLPPAHPFFGSSPLISSASTTPVGSMSSDRGHNEPDLAPVERHSSSSEDGYSTDSEVTRRYETPEQELWGLEEISLLFGSREPDLSNDSHVDNDLDSNEGCTAVVLYGTKRTFDEISDEDSLMAKQNDAMFRRWERYGLFSPPTHEECCLMLD